MNRFALAATAAALIALLTTGFFAVAQDRAKTQPAKAGDAQTKRLVYVVQHGSAKELAAVLGKHFKDVAEFEATAYAGGGMLLINAKSAVLDDVLATLAKLDRRPQQIAVDFYLLDLAPAAKIQPGDVDEKLLSGPAERVFANLKKLQGQGAFADMKHFQLVTLENQSARLMSGGSKPYITGSVVMTKADGKPRTTNTINYRDTGTQLTVMPSVGAGDMITVHVSFDESRMVPSTRGIAIGTDEKGQPILTTEFPKVTYNATLSLKTGQAVLAKDVQTTSGGSDGKTLVVVSARVLN